MVLYRFPCEILSFDLQDIMMSHHPNIGSIKKYRLDANGERLDKTDFEILREPDIKEFNTEYIEENLHQYFKRCQGDTCNINGTQKLRTCICIHTCT